jgi:hypothetical protein
MADFDTEVVERQLIPLAEPALGAGLGALGAASRYALASRLYRTQEGDTTKRAPDDRSALGAAASKASAED